MPPRDGPPSPRDPLLARIGLRLANEVRLDALLVALCELCVDELGFAGVTLVVDDPAAHPRTAQAGRCGGEPWLVPLQRAGRRLGTLSGWSEHGPRAALVSLLPWLVFAIENAVTSEAATSQQRQLEEQVEAQRRTNAALEASEARWRALVHGMPDTVLTLAPDGRFTFVNRPQSGVTAEQLLGARMDAFSADPEVTAEQLRRVFAFGETVDAETVFTGPDGVPRHYNWRMGPVTLDDRVVAGVLVVRDDTARVRAEHERRDLERRVLHAQKLESLGVLAGGIAHDFNNLLMGITANAELAAMQLPDLHPARRNIDMILNAGERAGELTRQMLAYAGRRAVRPEPVDLTAMVVDLGELLASALHKRVRMVTELSAELPAVDADPAQLQQVVLNLLTNAADAIGDATGEVLVRTGLRELAPEDLTGEAGGSTLAPGQYVVFEVQDTGTGISPEVQPRIFDPFFTTKGPGRGLGLAAVLGIVQAHRGGMFVRSEPRYGTVFRVVFPPSAGGRPRGRRLRGEGGGRRLVSRTLLVVDDEAVVRHATAELLRHHGATVLAAPDGEDALRQFDAHPEIDLVLLDLTMPGATGDEIFDAIRARRPDARVVLTSGHDARDAVAALRMRGLVAFLRKPFDGRQLVEVIEAALA